MSLSWKDALATVLVGTAGVITYARFKGFDWPLLNSWRMGTLALLVIGLGTCIAVGSGVVPTKDIWTMSASALGIVAFGLAILGLALGSKILFFVLAADILLLWIVSTTHHVFTTGT
jgi:hypothetical protein